MGRREWVAVSVGVVVGILIVVLGLVYLVDLASEMSLRLGEMIHG